MGRPTSLLTAAELDPALAYLRRALEREADLGDVGLTLQTRRSAQEPIELYFVSSRCAAIKSFAHKMEQGKTLGPRTSRLFFGCYIGWVSCGVMPFSE